MSYVQLLLREIEGGKKKKRGKGKWERKKRKSESGDFFSPPGFVRFELTSPIIFFSHMGVLLFSFFFIAHLLLLDLHFGLFF